MADVSNCCTPRVPVMTFMFGNSNSEAAQVIMNPLTCLTTRKQATFAHLTNYWQKLSYYFVGRR